MYHPVPVWVHVVHEPVQGAIRNLKAMLRGTNDNAFGHLYYSS
jgi:hypothetical protein